MQTLQRLRYRVCHDSFRLIGLFTFIDTFFVKLLPNWLLTVSWLQFDVQPNSPERF